MSYTPALNTILLGDPKAPTPTAGDNDTSIATTAFVTSAITAAVPTNSVTTNTVQTITGQKTFQGGFVVTQTGGGGTASTVTAASTGILDINNGINAVNYYSTNAGTTNPVYNATTLGSSSSAKGYIAAVSGDSFNFFEVNGDRSINIGGGTIAPDIKLTRAGAGILAIGATQKIQQNAAPTTGDDLTNKTYVDTVVAAATPTNMVTTNTAQTITGAKTFTTSTTVFNGSAATVQLTGGSNLFISGTGATSQLIATAVAGDAVDNRFQISSDGKHTWGTGAAIRDTNLYRSDVSSLTTDGNLTVAGNLIVDGSGGVAFGTGGDAAFTRTGAGVIGVTGKIQQTTTPTQDQDLVNKAYVDAARTGLDQKASVRAATTANITLSGTQTIDGVALIAGDRVLVQNQTTGADNGIYVVAAGAWSRATDADSSAEVSAGLFTFVSEGTQNGNNGFTLITDDPITLGTTSLTFTQSSGAGQLTAGNGLTKTANTIDVVGTTNRITANADNIDISSSYVGQTSITTLGTVSTGTWSGATVAIAFGGTGGSSVSTAQANLDITTLSTAQTITGAKTFGAEIKATSGLVNGSATSGGEQLIRGIRNADSFNRFFVSVDGTHSWGGGTGAPEITLSRTAANTLSLGSGNTIQSSFTPATGNDLTNKTYVDSKVSGVQLETPTTVTSNYTALTTDRTVLVNATSPSIISLPATHTSGQKINVKDISGAAGTNNITVNSADGDLLDGATTAVISTNSQALTFLSNGTNWFII